MIGARKVCKVVLVISDTGADKLVSMILDTDRLVQDRLLQEMIIK